MQKSIFFKDNLLEVNKELATVIGLKESMVLGEINFCNINNMIAKGGN